MALAPVTQELRERFELGESVKGVVVTKVNENSPAAERGLRPGDVIVEVSQEEVTSPAQVQAKIREAQTGNRKTILVMIERQGEQRFVALRVDPKGG
jgi:serine protease Do